MNLYFISGLGADKRVFQKLVLPDVFTVHHIEWVPVFKDESMETYCQKLSEQIDRSKPFILIGLSFGGVIAIQMSKFLSPVQTVIISSFCLSSELPRFYILLAKTKIYRLLPSRMLLKPNRFIFRLFGAGEPMKKKLLTAILEDTDPVFFRWAVQQLFTLKNDWKPESFLHIHGTADKILPFNENMGAIPVEGGEHLMVYSRAEQVSELLTLHFKKDPGVSPKQNRTQKTDEHIENRLLWKAQQYNLPSKFAFYFKDLPSDIQDSLLASIDTTASGNPVLFFTRPTKEWTLICTKQVTGSDTKKIIKLNMGDIKQILPTEFDPRLIGQSVVIKTIKNKAEWNEIRIVDRQNVSHTFYADNGADLFSLWNILLMAKSLTGV